MFDHVGIRVADQDASKRFYATVLAALGIELDTDEPGLLEWDDFALGRIRAGAPRRRAGCTSASWRRRASTSTRSGGRAPRPGSATRRARPAARVPRRLLRRASCSTPTATAPRPSTTATCARAGTSTTCGSASPTCAAAAAFYREISPSPASSCATRTPAARTSPAPPPRSCCSRTSGRPSTCTSRSRRTRTPPSTPSTHAAIAAGYRDNGGPGERPEYHEGYYGAFVLDPDGNNIEVVCHNRGHSDA